MRSLSGAEVELVLCDADGNLFPSEEPAFGASVRILSDFMGTLGVTETFSAAELRRATSGQNFRRTAAQLAGGFGHPAAEDELEMWVGREADEVTAHLAAVLAPDAEVQQSVRRLSESFELAVVSSSALRRVNACLEVCGLDAFFPSAGRFSAEDSLPLPRSKPDPAIYLHALAMTAVPAERAVAIEDSVAGVQSATLAGICTVANVCFVPVDEREERARTLRAAGGCEVFSSWPELVEFIVGLRERRSAGVGAA